MAELKIKLLIFELLAIIMLIEPCWSYREISGILDEAKDLSHEEINALRPLFEELQLQYDFVTSHNPEETFKQDKEFDKIYNSTLKEFEQQLNAIFPQEANATQYDTTLPTIEEIMGKPDFENMTKEQQMEFLDMKSILLEALDEAQINLDALVARSLKLESDLLKINKPKITKYIFKALNMGYKVSARVGRASYCTYSHIPQLNTSLHSLYEGVDCYLYTTSLIVKIQNETYQTVKKVKKHVFELAAVYKKVAAKNSLMGKIISATLNIPKATVSIFSILRAAHDVIDGVINQLPSAAREVEACSSNFVTKIPHIIESVANVTECILFVDNTKMDYDFMVPEGEYYKQPASILGDIEKEDEDLGDSK